MYILFMLATKVIKCKIINLTKIKQVILDNEWFYFQEALQLYNKGLDILPIYDRVRKKIHSINLTTTIWQNKKIKSRKEYPINLHNKFIKVEEKDTKLTKYWIRIPVKGRRGGIWLPMRPHQDIPKDVKIADSKLIKKGDTYWIHLTIKKEVTQIKSYSNILAIDLGEKVIATVCGSFEQRPLFLGREVRGIRRHYAWLRKRLGNKKLLKKVKQIGQKEQRKVDEVLHNISKAIVSISVASNSIIVLGDLKGICSSTKGKRFNRIVHDMPYFKLTQYIEYKANWEGIKVIKIDERGTSHTCSKCGSKGTRPYQGLFKCSTCNYQVNADYNGAKNILKRSLDYISKDGAIAFSPKTDLESVSTRMCRAGTTR